MVNVSESPYRCDYHSSTKLGKAPYTIWNKNNAFFLWCPRLGKHLEKMVNVVYFEQLLGAAHSKSKLKNTFSLLFEQKRRKAGKLMQNYLFKLVLKSHQKEAFTGATLKALFFIWHQFSSPFQLFCTKSIFHPAFGLPSYQTLVKIFNR